MSATVLSPESAEPMMEINTTPLIDVMLVLLIMFIITIPVQTHAVKIDLPVDQPNQTPPPVDPVKNKVVVMPNDAILWNGTPVDLVRLRQYLDYTTTLTPTPELHLQPHPEARYEQVDEVLAVTKRANIQSMGLVGNEAYANF
ncbi:MAG: ExbD/TolR family protein [Sphingosinicella sp.]|uniref:ExbD/TolR family protein n=1 Tax=Sphingosinicella sp. TaxID=1917971 RepID=UPI004038095C